MSLDVEAVNLSRVWRGSFIWPSFYEFWSGDLFLFLHDFEQCAELTPVQLDHSYAKPWNWRQELAHCKPVRTLFPEPTNVTYHK